jgi:hypothetical protein
VDSEWFTPLDGQCSSEMIMVPLKYIGSKPLVDLEVTASGDHVEDVGDQGGIFDGPVADLGDVAPGSRCVIMVRIDGTPGQLEVTLDLRANGQLVHRLVIESTGSGTARGHRAPGALTVER